MMNYWRRAEPVFGWIIYKNYTGRQNRFCRYSLLNYYIKPRRLWNINTSRRLWNINTSSGVLNREIDSNIYLIIFLYCCFWLFEFTFVVLSLHLIFFRIIFRNSRVFCFCLQILMLTNPANFHRSFRIVGHQNILSYHTIYTMERTTDAVGSSYLPL